MESSLWILCVIMAFAFAYMMQLYSATLALGRELADFSSKTGFQEAVAPPWEAYLMLAVQVVSVAVIGIMWWQLGGLSALGGAAVIFFGASLTKRLLPKPTSAHYIDFITRSMLWRYADYVRDGDTLRASAMKQLLVKAGFDPEQ